MKNPVPLDKAYLLLNHGPTTLVTTAHAGKRNVMAAAWVMSLDFNPPKVLAVISADSFTRKLIEASGEFGLSLPGEALADLTLTVGSVSGADGDKFEKYKIPSFPGSKIAAPLIEGCLGWLECKVIPEPKLAEQYDLLLAEVVAASADSEAFGTRGWKFEKGTRRHFTMYRRGPLSFRAERSSVPS